MYTEFNNKMTSLELRATLSLASVYVVRMLGLFMILPVFALYAEKFDSTGPLLIGLALGIYGLTQAMFQIPLGMLSDRIGRKPVIIGGLLVFAAGSILAAASDSIYGIIAGRALQGSGAIAATLMALAADLSREEQRTKVMALIGVSIGASFLLALVSGPILARLIGVPGIFGLTALMAFVSIGIIVFAVPRPRNQQIRRDAQVIPSSIADVVRNSQLLRLDFGVFALHMILPANFIILPAMLRDSAGIASQDQWEFYLPVLVLSFLLMLPFMTYAERLGRVKTVFIGAIVLLAISELSLGLFAPSIFSLLFTVLLFFIAFNYLEAALPSLVSKLAAPDARGTSLGVYSTSQFMGAFVGGALGGALVQWQGPQAVFYAGAVVMILWAIVAGSMSVPANLSNYLLNVGKINAVGAQSLSTLLNSVRGVAEAVVVPEEGIAYLKVDRKLLDETQLQVFSTSSV